MRLEELREKNHFTQSEVARMIGLNARNYNRYEKGKSEPDIETLILLADFFHTSIDYIVGRKTDLINLSAISEDKAMLIKDILAMKDDEIEYTKNYFNGLLRKK